jgi:hypothetical protein
MFSKLSRYRRVPDIAVPDARGRVLAAKDIRPLPDVTGTFRHTVDSGDRLDQLSYTYYGDPLRYWHITDANPQFLSPLALVGAEPVTTTRFPVTVTAGDPPWTAAIRALAAVVGVEDTRVEEDFVLVEQRQNVGGQQVTVTVKRFERALLVRHSRVAVDAAPLAAVIAAAGFTVGPPAASGQIGEQILIPPAGNG